MAKEKDDISSNIPNSENIFDDFTNSDEIKKEIEKNELSGERDIYFYFKKVSSFLLVLNILTLLCILLGMFYIYVQDDSQRKEYSYLTPVCSLFLGTGDYFPNTCYGVSSVLVDYKQKLNEEQDSQVSAITPLLGEVYSLENYNLSKKVSFILEKSEDRLRPLEILASFDDIKNIYSPTDKGEIDCYDISISKNILNVTCDSYSSDWNTDIITVSDTTLLSLPGGGTSISKASSFLNFLENYSKSPFEMVEKPLTLSSEATQISPYTQKTTFTFQLLYIQESTYQIN